MEIKRALTRLLGGNQSWEGYAGNRLVHGMKIRYGDMDVVVQLLL